MEKIIVTKHKSVEEYIRKKKLVPEGTKCYPSVSPEFVEGKHVFGIIPFHIACQASLFTEVKLTLRRDLYNMELSLDQLEAMVQQIRTYKVKEVVNLK